MRLLLPTGREDASGFTPRDCAQPLPPLAARLSRTQPPPPPPLPHSYQSKRGGPNRSALCSLLRRTFQNLRHLLTGASTGPSTCHFRFLLLEPSRKILPNGRMVAPAGGLRRHGDRAAARTPLAAPDRACPTSIPPSPPRGQFALQLILTINNGPKTTVAHEMTPSGSVRLPDAEELLNGGRQNPLLRDPRPLGLPTCCRKRACREA